MKSIGVFRCIAGGGMVEPSRVPAVYERPSYERLGESKTEPRFPDPYMGVYLDLVHEMEEDMAVIPGMGTLARILIRRVARDHVAALMADRGDSVAGTIVCGSCRSQVFTPLWPENNARLLRSASELLKQARSADLGQALRTEFVLGLVTETMSVLDSEISDVEQRVLLKEKMREAFSVFLKAQQSRRLAR